MNFQFFPVFSFQLSVLSQVSKLDRVPVNAGNGSGNIRTFSNGSSRPQTSLSAVVYKQAKQISKQISRRPTKPLRLIFRQSIKDPPFDTVSGGLSTGPPGPGPTATVDDL